MTAPLTPTIDEQIRAVESEADVVETSCINGAGIVLRKAAESLQHYKQLAAELEEANRRAQKWAEEAGRYAALADFWRKRALAAERQLIEKYDDRV